MGRVRGGRPPRLSRGGEAAISIARPFAAGVLVLIGGRLRWVACGFVVLGLGQLIFGYLAPILETTTDLNDSLYASTREPLAYMLEQEPDLTVVAQAGSLAEARQKDREARLAFEQLTDRELEVLQALADGQSDKEISAHFHISLATVRSHVTSVLAKFQATSRLQALVLAVRHGIVTID